MSVARRGLKVKVLGQGQGQDQGSGYCGLTSIDVSFFLLKLPRSVRLIMFEVSDIAEAVTDSFTWIRKLVGGRNFRRV